MQRRKRVIRLSSKQASTAGTARCSKKTRSGGFFYGRLVIPRVCQGLWYHLLIQDTDS